MNGDLKSLQSLILDCDDYTKQIKKVERLRDRIQLRTTTLSIQTAEEALDIVDRVLKYSKDALRAVEQLSIANSTRPDYDIYCDECGRAHILDCVLPSEIWNQIARGEEVLCPICIDKRMVDTKLKCDDARFYFAGTNLSSRLYVDDTEGGGA